MMVTGKNATETLLADAAGTAKAAQILKQGGLVAVPTETVYGLAARADSDDAVAGIYTAKGRPSFNPLIVHVADLAQAKELAVFSGMALRVAESAWPGALTLVLPLKSDAPVAAAITAGLSSIALRCPAHPVMRALIDKTGFPIAAPSANRSNAISPTNAAHVEASLGGRIDLILDGGECAKGLESSILALRDDGGWDELRPGPVDIAALHKQITGKQWRPAQTTDKIEAPGQLARHYSPGKPLRLGVTVAEPYEVHIGFGALSGDLNLSEKGDLAQAAARLYAMLHQAASSPQPRIAVAPIPDHGIGAAINDRLKRAAA